MTPLLALSLGNYILASAIYIHDGPTLLGLVFFFIGTGAAMTAAATGKSS